MLKKSIYVSFGLKWSLYHWICTNLNLFYGSCTWLFVGNVYIVWSNNKKTVEWYELIPPPITTQKIKFSLYYFFSKYKRNLIKVLDFFKFLKKIFNVMPDSLCNVCLLLLLFALKTTPV